MQKSRQKIKITHNPAVKNNHIDVVVTPGEVFFFFWPVHVYIMEYEVLHLYPSIIRNTLIKHFVLYLVLLSRFSGCYNRDLRGLEKKNLLSAGPSLAGDMQVPVGSVCKPAANRKLRPLLASELFLGSQGGPEMTPLRQPGPVGTQLTWAASPALAFWLLGLTV